MDVPDEITELKEDRTMLKRERLNKIASMVEEKGIINVSELIETLNISDMTARRDLDELERSGKLIRFHGGAQSMSYNLDAELSHLEKTTIHVKEKKEIAEYAATLIKDKETVFLGPGTTIEMLASLLLTRDVRVVTNSLPVFKQFSDKGNENCILVGGDYRAKTGCFVGGLANSMMASLKCQAAFFSCNGIFNDQVSTSSVGEGEIQNIAVNNSQQRYLLADEHKFNHSDFYVYYHLYNLDAVVTNSSIPKETVDHYQKYVQILIPSKNES